MHDHSMYRGIMNKDLRVTNVAKGACLTWCIEAAEWRENNIGAYSIKYYS
jgi:hypothetical protein